MKPVTRILLRSLTLLAMLAVVILVLVFWYGDDSDQRAGKSFLSVAVTLGAFERTVSSTGTLAAVETVTVGTEVSGTVEKVLVDYNDQVSKGQVLAVLKPDLFNAAVADAQGAVDQAAANLELAQQELVRNRPLYDKG